MADRKRPQLWRYEVDEVWGDAPVSVGTVLIDKWKADRTWTVYNLTTMEPTCGWHCKLLGKCPPDVAENVYKQAELAKSFQPLSDEKVG